MTVGARQSFQFFRKNTWYLKNNRTLPKFLYGVSHYLISIIKIIIKQVHKKHFKLTTQATLNSLNDFLLSECGPSPS